MDTTPKAFLSGAFVRAIPSLVSRTPARQGHRRPDLIARAMAWLGGFIATGAALAVGAFLAVFAAAAVAAIALIAGVLVFLTGLAFRARRMVYARSSVIEARRVGHAWVTYGWDRPAR
jgi:apolipoprotein N-acyltransferase